MQVIGLIWGIIAICIMFVATIPLLGWLNWGNIPFAIVGLIISVIAMLTAKRSKGLGITGIVLCCIAIIWGIVRLKAGWGIL
jgi:hypothetical protein